MYHKANWLLPDDMSSSRAWSEDSASPIADATTESESERLADRADVRCGQRHFPRLLLCHSSLNSCDAVEPWVSQRLASTRSICRVDGQELGYEILCIIRKIPEPSAVL